MLETWHVVLAVTVDPWFHPSWFSRSGEWRGDEFPDIISLARLPTPGGVFAFLHMPRPDPDDATMPGLWREDWPDFLAPYFDIEERDGVSGRILVATRSKQMTEYDGPEWFQPD